MTLVYLHGFASSPYGSKVTHFRQRCAEGGITLLAPDLNQPSFERMTVTAGIKAAAQTIEEAPPGPVHLIGSSLGGLAALHLLDSRPDATRRVERLVLLAPGLGLAQRWKEIDAFADVEQWRETGWLTVHNYATDQPERIHYGFYDDALQYDGFSVAPPIPTHIVHGRHDETVPVAFSERYANMHPGITLDVLDADHGLTTRVGSLWATLVWFFGLEGR